MGGSNPPNSAKKIPKISRLKGCRHLVIEPVHRSILYLQFRNFFRETLSPVVGDHHHHVDQKVQEEAISTITIIIMVMHT